MHTDYDTPILIAGGGPAGLILALTLSSHGVKSTVTERNLDTTKWPKMDITNCRSMELFNRLGIQEGFREQGVPQNFSFDVLFSSGLSDGGKLVSKWDLPPPDWWREHIKENNDGTMPREPYQRCSQAVLEAWLKPRLLADPLIDARWGLKFESFVETADGVESTLTDVETGEKKIIKSQYLAGCDGASSRIRKALDIPLDGGPVPAFMMLVHFKSRDLSVLHKQGQFWHIFFSHGGVIISQDEVDTWTVHIPMALGTSWQERDPIEAIEWVLGGSSGPCPIKVDEVLLKSAWQPSIAVARRYLSDGGRVFLTGDAAHQNIPTGGYGMNTAVGDSFDLGWKLAAAVKGYGGKTLLQSYQEERKPVAHRNVEHSGVHFGVHHAYTTWIREAGEDTVLADNDKGEELRARWLEHVVAHDGENKDHGIELGYRYNGSSVIIPDEEGAEPEWTLRSYNSSTWPGARAPHVYLADGETSIYDLFGADFSLVDFSKDGQFAKDFTSAAEKLNIPLKPIHLPSEDHVHKVWERDAVLVRPDDHVAWRLPSSGEFGKNTPESILRIATGQSSN